MVGYGIVRKLLNEMFQPSFNLTVIIRYHPSYFFTEKWLHNVTMLHRKLLSVRILIEF